MKRTRFLFLLLIAVCLALPLTAQEDGGENDTPASPPIGSDWDDYIIPELYARGDKTFNISLGILIPTVFTGDAMEDNPHNIKLGGMGSFAFNYFLGSRFFLGGELGGMFAATRGENMLYIVPFGIRVGYQFVLKRFEFPLTLMVGGAPQKYLDKGYFGLIIKPGAAGFFRFNPDWSFGLNLNWWMVPEWPKNGKNVLGNFLEITLSARYHF